MNDLLKNLLLHKPIPCDYSKSFEASLAQEEPLQFHDISIGSGHFMGRGSFKIEDMSVSLSINNHYDSWMEGDPQDGDYVNYGRGVYTLPIDALDWTSYHRLYLDIAYEALGYVNPHIIVSFKNEGSIQIPDVYNREGYHGINLEANNKTYIIDISDLPRDAITELSFHIMAGGKDLAALDTQTYRISNVRLATMDTSSENRGWDPKQAIVYSHNGYATGSKKTAIGREYHDTFTLVHTDSTVAYTGFAARNEQGYIILDFSDFDLEGDYSIQYGTHTTEPFHIGSHHTLWINSIHKTLNFVYCQRCGTPVSSIHCTCHSDVIATHQGTSISFNGGWHDAGDLSQQLVQTAEVTVSLLEIANQLKDSDVLLSHRLIEECEWGIDFILKTRMGDGNRATSAGVTRWSNNRMGDDDDSFARVHDCPYENYFLAGMTSYLAQNLPEGNRLIPRLKQIAIEDYQYAKDAFIKAPYATTPIFWEHTYSTSESLYDATIAWSSVMLYKQTLDASYKENALLAFDSLLQSQHVDTSIHYKDSMIRGFFYRDKTHKVVNHFNHQSREHLYAYAFESMIQSFSDHKDCSLWKQRASFYADSLEFIGSTSNPYGMMASGLYRFDEYLDTKSFETQHLLIGDEAYLAYTEQLKNGIKISDTWYLRAFPVWFSFRGNNGILLSSGKSASVMGNLLHRRALIDMAENQLKWNVGMNPFGQSLMYGEGHHYAQQYTVQSGEMVGELPVGVQTFENDDEPYWSQFNNATYKEVWTGLAGKWMSIVADLINEHK